MTGKEGNDRKKESWAALFFVFNPYLGGANCFSTTVFEVEQLILRPRIFPDFHRLPTAVLNGKTNACRR